MNDELFHNYAKTAVTYYSPEKTFVYLKFRKSLMVIHIYTNQKVIDGVKNIKYHENWGEARIRNEKDLLKVIEYIKISYGLIRQAIKDNINTGWYAVTPKEKMAWLKPPENDDDVSEDEK